MYTAQEYKLHVTLPQKLSLNQYHTYHYQKLNQIKHQFYTEVQFAKKTGVLPNPPYDSHYHFQLYGALMDITNLVGMVKPLEDGLVRNGIIPDDNKDIIKTVRITQEHTTEPKKKISYCIITLTHHGK